jgi:hypothetical protein
MEQGQEARKALELKEISDWLDGTLLPALIKEHPELGEYATYLRHHLAAVYQRVLEEFRAAPALDKIAILAAGVVEIINLLEPSADFVAKLPGALKKSAATTLIIALYERADAGADGAQDNFKLPWVPAGLSNRIERWILKFACDWGIEIGVAMLNKLTKG